MSALSTTKHFMLSEHNGTLEKLERHFISKQATIESWLRDKWQETPAPFYASVDLRNAGFKISPVDTNLFPAGFNNLNHESSPLAIQALQAELEQVCPTAKNVLLIPENHTRNLLYLESIASLEELITKAGYNIKIGSLNEEVTEKTNVTLPSGKTISLHPVCRHNNLISIDDFTPCVILLNNDLANGRPDILENLDQIVTPPLSLGWANRLKSDHFNHYRKVAHEFSHHFDIDPWLIDPLFLQCGKINFLKREGEECLAQNVDTLLTAIQKKYDEYQISQKPFVVVKADSGTYGMGVMMVHSTDEITGLNRKQRTKMSASKGGNSTSQVILQEGVYTFETLGPNQAVAEPVLYMINRYVVGGFYRVHTDKGINDNLNAPGMHFEPLPFTQPCNTPESSLAPDAFPNRLYTYSIIARLALLAAASELHISQL